MTRSSIGHSLSSRARYSCFRLCGERESDTGFFGWVQGTGKEPKDGQPVSYDKVPDFEDYGLGCFLLAGSAVYRLAGR